MDELSPGPAAPPPPERVGDVLRAARERRGLSLAEIAARTRVPLRHLEAIEANSFGNLPSATYASGFAKAYARIVGVDEVAIGRSVRGELAGVTRAPAYQPFEATDPARVPSRGVAIVALGLVVAVLVLAGLYFSTGLFHRGLGVDAPVDSAAVASVPDAIAVAPSPVAALPPDGQVLVTATDEVWVRIYDADGKTIHQGTLQPGDHFDVPTGANQPMINVGRPDKIAITVNGAAVPGLDLGNDPIRDVRISAAALAARATDPAATPTPTASPSATVSTRPRTADSRPARRAERPRRAQASALSETQRANIDAARTSQAPGNAQ